MFGSIFLIYYFLIYCAGVLHALEHCHLRHIIYRDLKPENCLLRGKVVCLGDLGLSRPQPSETAMGFKALPPSQPCMQRQITKHVVTRWYRAPEVLLPGEGYSESMDVWSAGCIAGELLQLVPHGGEAPSMAV